MMIKKNQTQNGAPACRRRGRFVLAALSASKTTVGALPLFLLAAKATAASFSFSTGDVEIDAATRNGCDGSLRFAATLVNASFTALSSVVNGIHPAPGEFTRGEGDVTGEEVMITVGFNPPIALPAGHYFFRPEVDSSRGDFLWLSAPRPIVTPGTPFMTDLQSWSRNDELAPDWLRIGTDITHQGPFNAVFSLSDEPAENGTVVGQVARVPYTADSFSFRKQ